jgi:hypothetical protein
VSVASHRPGALVGCYAYRAASAALITLPLGHAFGTVLAQHPRGDAVMWDRGGLWLLEATRLAAPSLGGAVWQVGLWSLVAAFGWLLPLGALITSQAPERPSAAGCLARSGERFGRLALLLGAAILIQALTMGAFVALGKYVGTSGGHVSEVLGFALPLSGLVVWWLITMLHDALRVVSLHRDVVWWACLNHAWSLLANRWRASLWAAFWPTALALVGVLAAGAAAVDMTLAGASVAAIVLVQQLAIFAVVVLRASWLGWLGGRLAKRPKAAPFEQ